MHALNRFEANLLQILYGVLGDTAHGPVMGKVYLNRPTRLCISRTAIELVQAALAKGITHWLAVQGGWRTERNMRGDRIATGSIWQRTSPRELGLTFSSASLKLLMWLTAHDPREDAADPWSVISPTELTTGDQLLILRMLDYFRDFDVGQRWFRMTKFASLPLVALSYPDQILNRERPIEVDFAACLPELALTLECLQPWLVSRWTDVEKAKATTAEIEVMQRLGVQQTAILEAYLSAAIQHGRRDLARFLLVTLQKVAMSELAPEQLARRWIRGLRLGDLRLAERTIVYQSASSFLAFSQALRACTEQCRQVGYFDEGYTAAQLWLSDWERYDGEQASLRALAMVRALSV